MKGLKKKYWKLHPSWLGSIDSAKFNTLPLWKNRMAICPSLSAHQILINLHTILEQNKGLHTIFGEKKREVVYNFWPPLVWGASISCLHSLLHGKDKEDLLRQYVTWTKIAILENWYNNVPRCFQNSKSWKWAPQRGDYKMSNFGGNVHPFRSKPCHCQTRFCNLYCTDEVCNDLFSLFCLGFDIIWGFSYFPYSYGIFCYLTKWLVWSPRGPGWSQQTEEGLQTLRFHIKSQFDIC